MAKAETSPTAISWPPEGLPIDVACKSIMAPLWDAYVKARDEARDIHRMFERFKPLSLRADEQRRLTAYEGTRAALGAALRASLERGEYELWACLGSLIAEPQPIPASAIDGLEIDYEKRTARGEGLPPLYDVHLRRGRAARLPRGSPRQYDYDAIKAVGEDILRRSVPSKKSTFFGDVRDECDKKGIARPPPDNDKTMREIFGDCYERAQADSRNKGSNR
jgi:hypothetical protein